MRIQRKQSNPIGLDESQKLDPWALDESQEQKKKWQIKAKPYMAPFQREKLYIFSM